MSTRPTDISKNGRALRLDVALIARYPQLSRRKAREVIEKGQVTRNNESIREAGTRVAADDSIVWDPNRKAQPRARISLPTLFADNRLIIVDKPAGLLSVPSGPHPSEREDTALARVLDYARHLDPRRPFARAAHRIDRDTSGALTFALDAATHQALRHLFHEHRIERTYLALAAGRPAQDHGTVTAPIHDSYVSGKRRIARPGEEARPARTDFVVRERFPGACLIELTLATGRQHQIRLHLTQAGLFILGDEVYRPEAAMTTQRAPRQMLHAWRLAFVHPWTGARIAVESPLPRDFSDVLGWLRTRSRRGR
jgi:23S rRNA pseudouridine1911/1915/1917 synthase